MVQMAAVCSPLGILQQPGEPFVRPQLAHFGWSGLQHKSPPFIWPQPVQSSTLAARAVLDFLQPLTHTNTPANVTTIRIVSNLLLVFIFVSFPRKNA
jgi:hypothetical protein